MSRPPILWRLGAETGSGLLKFNLDWGPPWKWKPLSSPTMSSRSSISSKSSSSWKDAKFCTLFWGLLSSTSCFASRSISLSMSASTLAAIFLRPKPPFQRDLRSLVYTKVGTSSSRGLSEILLFKSSSSEHDSPLSSKFLKLKPDETPWRRSPLPAKSAPTFFPLLISGSTSNSSLSMSLAPLMAPSRSAYFPLPRASKSYESSSIGLSPAF